MSYEDALEATGAKIISFKAFGSYQGEWFALVEYEGKRGWISGGYGSCTGCDAFEAEFGFGSKMNVLAVGEKDWDGECYRDATQADVDDYKARLSAFGKGYLTHIMSQKEAEDEAAKDLSWDADAEAMVKFVKSFAES